MGIWTTKEKEYLQENYGKIPTSEIGIYIHKKARAVNTYALKHNMEMTQEQKTALRKPYKPYCRKYNYVSRRSSLRDNPNPISTDTEMIVCRCHYEGKTIDDIGDILMRPNKVIEKIIKDCQDDRSYSEYNKFGR